MFKQVYWMGVCAVLVAVPAGAAEYRIDPAHTSIAFEVSHLTITSVNGRFNDFSGAVEFDADDIASASAHLVIDVASIDTGNDKRDEHLRSDDFFGADTHPKIVFQSTGIHNVDGKSFQVDGELTIRDVTHPVVLDAVFNGKADDPWGGVRVGFRATTQVERKAFGIAPDTASAMIGNDIGITLNVEAVHEPKTEDKSEDETK